MNRHSRNQPTITINVASVDSDVLVEEKDSRRAGRYVAERFAALRRVDSFKTDAQGAPLRRRDDIDGVPVDDGHNLRIK
jgi:hypothetical protein